MITATIEVITPAIAEQMLANRPYQRRIRRSRVELYKRQMEGGMWHETGEAIKIDTDGNLCDGQHRLTAIVESGLSQKMLVVRGIKPVAFDAMDQGAPRTPGDTLSRIEFKHADAVGAVCAALRGFNKSSVSFAKGHTHRLAREEVRLYAEARRERLESAVSLAKSIRGLTGPKILGTFFYLVEYIDAEKAQAFAAGLRTGANLSVNSPVLRVRNKLLEMRGMTRNGMDIVELFPILTVGWNKHFAGEDMTALRVPTTTRLTMAGAPKPGTVAWEQWV